MRGDRLTRRASSSGPTILGLGNRVKPCSLVVPRAAGQEPTASGDAGSLVLVLPQKMHHRSGNLNPLATGCGLVSHERRLRSYAPCPAGAVVDRSGLGPWVWQSTEQKRALSLRGWLVRPEQRHFRAWRDAVTGVAREVSSGFPP